MVRALSARRVGGVISAVDAVYGASARGGGRPDHLLEPERHADALGPEAGPLARVLRRDEVRETIARYRAADAEAIFAQASYRRIGAFGAASLLLPQLAAAAILIAGLGPLATLVLDADLAGIAVFAQFLGLAAALAAAYALRIRAPFERWMSRRAAAEVARVELFDAVVQADEPHGPGEEPIKPLALEYFHRYQLDVQRAYYATKAKSHAVAAGRSQTARRLNIALFFLMAIPAGLGAAAFLGLRPPVGSDANSVFLALGAAGAGFVAYFNALSLLSLDARNAARYASVAESLRLLDEAMRDRARQAAAEGDWPTLAAYVASVHRLISSEHQEWIDASERRPRLDLQILGDAQG